MECTCLCGCVRVPVIVHVCPYLWRSGTDTRHFFLSFLTLFFETGSLSVTEIMDSSRPSDQEAPETYLPLLCLAFTWEMGDLNSGSEACVASTYLTEPFSQPPV